MTTTLKKIIFCSLIACYGLIAILGNVVVLKELLNSGDKQHRLTSEGKSRSIPNSPVWTIKAHIPPSIDSDLSVHFAPNNEVSSIANPTAIIENVEIALIYSSLEFLPSKPRDPPIV